MALRNRSEDGKRMSDDYLSSAISSSTLEVVLDDRSNDHSGDDDSNDQLTESKAGTTGSDHGTCRRKKTMPLRDPKSHRLIEKRRRDRMNICLNELLQLTPHENLDGQRRIEKTEIIEMATKHIHHLLSKLDSKSKDSTSSIDAYRTGYHNGLSDAYDYLEESSDNDQLRIELAQYIKEKDIDLKALIDVPEKKRTKYSSISDKRRKLTSLSTTDQITKPKEDNDLCVVTKVEEYTDNNLPSSIEERQMSTQQSNNNVKVPVFVLHPSGTHYIPMCIDASVVSHAFKKNSNSSHSSSTTEQAQCHPVSIPVNFNPITTFSDPYELDIQNINVIGTRHQTSVRPN